MLVVVQNAPAEILVQTVSLKHSESNNVFLFHCYRCGGPVAKINGEVSRIFPGLEPSDEVPVIKQCYKCHENYVFQTRDQIPSKPIKVVLSYTGHAIQNFNCPICRTHLIQFTDKVIVILPLYMAITLPAKVDDICSGCGTHYRFIDVI